MKYMARLKQEGYVMEYDGDYSTYSFTREFNDWFKKLPFYLKPFLRKKFRSCWCAALLTQVKAK